MILEVWVVGLDFVTGSAFTKSSQTWSRRIGRSMGNVTVAKKITEGRCPPWLDKIDHIVQVWRSKLFAGFLPFENSGKATADTLCLFCTELFHGEEF